MAACDSFSNLKKQKIYRTYVRISVYQIREKLPCLVILDGLNLCE